MQATMNRIAEQCREQGMRLTGPRKVIAEVLSSATDHPDALELYRRVSRHDETISISTVYRTLKRLEDAGILERHAFRDGRGRYERASDKHHDHLIDRTTGKVIEFSSPEIERFQAEVARKHGFRLVGHRLELYVEPIEKKKKRSSGAR